MEEGNNMCVTKSKTGSGTLIIKKKKAEVGNSSSSTSSGRQYEAAKRPRSESASSGSSDNDNSNDDDDDDDDEDDDGDERLMELYKKREEEAAAGGGGDGGGGGGGGSIVYRRKGTEAERKRSKLDVYEFDEYDDLTDVETTIGNSYFGGRMFRSEYGSGSSRGYSSIDRRKGKGSSSVSFVRNSSNGSGNSLGRNSFGSKIKVPGSSIAKGRFGSGGDEAIRLQGKNGVLKVMVNNKKKLNGTLVGREPKESGRNGVGAVVSREMAAAKRVIRRSPPNVENPVLLALKTTDGSAKDQARSRKVLPVKRSETMEESSEDSDISAKKPRKNKADLSMKRGSSEVRDAPLPDRIRPSAMKEKKSKRGSGTEKQLLRERIKDMLVSAGWTIDYRPRRGRDYHDAVYINPTGTAFWSIIKAYDAYQKQLEDEGAKDADEDSSLTPITDDVLSKLTRQTQKKIEKELKRKKRDKARLSKRKKGTASGKLVSDEEATDSSDSERLGENLSNAKCTQKTVKKATSSSNPSSAHGRNSKKIGRCTLLVRNSEKGLSSESDGFAPYKGKRNLLSWLIDAGLVNLNEKVRYMNLKRSKVMLQGWVTRDGIHCGCCSKILTVSKFEIHAASKIRQPYQNIHLSSGPSLLQCMLDAWNNQDESQRRGFHAVDVDGDDPNDDTCGICGDGGDLICCDGCPSTFHQSCSDIEMLPSGDWHCPQCSCKFCGLVEVTDADRTDSSSGSLSSCTLCQRKYHSSCMQEMDAAPAKPSNPSMSFCGWKCQELFDQIQKLLGVKHELDAGFSWSLIHRTDLEADNSLQGFSQRVEWNAKLAVAQTVMDECFLPIVDRRSGINLIHNVVYNCGSNFHRLNYSGFYTAILERGDEVISAASIRIHGTQVAEMPYIGTRHLYRRQGMFRQLFSAIESALRSLKVEKLIIPAISELMDTWTTVFGFSPLEEQHKKDMKSFNMLVFPGTDMILKQLAEPESSNRDNAASRGETLETDAVMRASGHDSAVGLKKSESNIDLSLHDSALGTSDVSDEAKPPQIIEGNQDTTVSVSEMDDKHSQSVIDVKPDNPSEMRTVIPEVEKASGDSPSEQDIKIKDFEDQKKDVAEETLVDVADAGSTPAHTEDNDPAQIPLDQNSVEGTQIDEAATPSRASHEDAEPSCEEAKRSVPTLKENSGSLSLDKEADDNAQQPSMEVEVHRVADVESVTEPQDDVNDGFGTDQPVESPVGSQKDVSNEEASHADSPKPEKLTTPHSVLTHESPSSKTPHPASEMEHSQLGSSINIDAAEADVEVGTSAHDSSSVGVLPPGPVKMKE